MQNKKSSKPFRRPRLALSIPLALIAVASLCLTDFNVARASSLFPASTGSTPTGDPATEKQLELEIETLLKEIETQWNNHDLENVMKYYDDHYVNNDGLDKKAVRELTKDFWKTYPDSKSSSKTRSIRIEGKFATVESQDKAEGSTEQELAAVSSKGFLTSISEGQLYLKKMGQDWKIIGDRIDYEKVTLAFGLSKDLKASFEAPQQVKSGQEYAAKLSVDLPPDLIAVGSITNEPLTYPQGPHKDNWRQIENQMLERIIHANKNNYNELLMATIGITDGSRKNLRGLTYLTRRLNVVPEAVQLPEKIVTDDTTATSMLDSMRDAEPDDTRGEPDASSPDDSSESGADSSSTDSDPSKTDSDSTKSDPESTPSDSDSSTDSNKTDTDSGKSDFDSKKKDLDSGSTDSDAGKSDSDSSKPKSDSGASDSDSKKTDLDAGKSDSDSKKTDLDSSKSDSDAKKTGSEGGDKPSGEKNSGDDK